MSDRSGISQVVATLRLRSDLAVEEPGEAEHQDVEGEADHELVRGEAMAHLGLDERHAHSAQHPGYQCNDGRTCDVIAHSRSEGTRQQHSLDRYVDGAGPLCHPFARGGEGQNTGEQSSVDVGTVRS